MSTVRPRVFVEQLGSRLGETVTVHGWIDTLRLQRRMQFVLVRDRTGLVQVTHRRGGEGDVIEAAFDAVTLESAVRITGRVVADSAVKLGGLELVPESVEVVAAAEPGLPIDERTGLDQRLDWRFLDVRRPSRQLLFAVQTTVERAMREFAYEQGCVELHTPKLMGSASESGAEVFAVEYFGRQAYLAQSPQFYKQMAIAGGLDRVFEIGPVFRAEPSFTSRHSTEFTGVDVELGWIEDVGEVMAFEERMLHRVLAAVREAHGPRIAEEFGVDVVVPELPFPRITMAQALERLRARGWQGPADAADLDPAGERMLSALIAEEYGHEFVFVTEFPSEVRPFYHLRSADGATTASFDLLWKGIEITTGAQREHRYEVLRGQAEAAGLEPASLGRYLDCFRYGTPPHGGFGLGLARVLMMLLGLESIREASFLFRGPTRLEP